MLQNLILATLKNVEIIGCRQANQISNQTFPQTEMLTKTQTT